MTTFLVEKEPGFGETAPGLSIPGKIDKMGYKGVDTTEAISENHEVSAGQVLGEKPGQGFYQMMDGVEVGHVNVAARASGFANRAFELGIPYAQQRETFGKPIVQHQATLFQLAEMATKVETAHAMMVRAARMKDRGERNADNHLLDLCGHRFSPAASEALTPHRAGTPPRLASAWAQGQARLPISLLSMRTYAYPDGSARDLNRVWPETSKRRL